MLVFILCHRFSFRLFLPNFFQATNGKVQTPDGANFIVHYEGNAEN